MQKKLLLLLLVALLAVPVKAQRSELGISGGVAFYLGDLNPTKIFAQPNASAGVFYRYNIDTRWALRAGLTYGRIAGDDRKYDNPRNLNFRNDIFDFSFMVEVNFLTFFTSNAKYYRFSPYLTAGIAAFFMDPKGYNFENMGGNTKWTSLKPLSTEGQGLSGTAPKSYSLANGSFPFGIGFKVAISSRVALGLEWTMRLSFTDYLDDVKGVYYDNNAILSNVGETAAWFADPVPNDKKHVAGMQRGDPNTPDWYSFTSVTLSIKLSTPEPNCPAYPQNAATKLHKSR
ncbi:MAG: DUF6089 family protein [Bacteroidales bacterium]|nr:DUF6089 family protein [Bacteroidales bacterium]